MSWGRKDNLKSAVLIEVFTVTFNNRLTLKFLKKIIWKAGNIISHGGILELYFLVPSGAGTALFLHLIRLFSVIFGVGLI